MMVFDKYSFVNIVARAYQLCGNIFKQGRVLLCYAGFVAVVSALLGRWSFSCDMGEKFWCYGYGNNYVAIIFLVLSFVCCSFLLLSFIDNFYQVSFNNEVFAVKKVFYLNKSKFKKAGALILYVLMVIFPLAVALSIFIKPANPNWKIEAIYFTVMFFAVLGSMFVIRLLSSVSFYYDKQKLPDMRKIIHVTSGHSLSTVMLFWCVCLMSNLIYMNVYRIMRHLNFEYDYFITAVAAEYVSSLAKLALICVIVALARAEQEIQENVINKSNA